MKTKSTAVAVLVVLLAFTASAQASISFTPLGDLAGGGFGSAAYGVSADGSTVVGHGNSGSGTEAFRWTAGGGMVGLGDLAGGGFGSVAYGVSADGSTVVGQSSSGSGGEAFRWTAGGGMVGLGDLAGGVFGSIALGVSADGSTVVGYGSSGSGTEAFLWDATHGMRSLHEVLTLGGIDLAGWQLFQARGISADGRYIVGHGANPTGFAEAWLVDLGAPTLAAVPEPFSAVVWAILIAGAIVAGCRTDDSRKPLSKIA